MDRNIIHLDLDAFFVSVERKLNPKLNGKPLIVGGGKRGVVAACSYETRRFGVHSAMPMHLALKLCPDAIVISGDMEAYTRHSREVSEVIADRAPVFEKASVDEFYVDASGMDRFHNTFQWALDLKKKIVKEVGLPISLAMSVNKTVSKVATDHFKPNAQARIIPGTERDFLAPLPIEKMPGIGAQTASMMHDMGIRDLYTLSQMPVEYLTGAFGKNGIALWKRANGIDSSEVLPFSEQKSVSTECTFNEDTTDVKHLNAILIAMVEKLAFKLREQKKLAACVAVKIRYSNFDTEMKQVHVPYTSSDGVILDKVQQLFKKVYTRRMRLRLVGVRLSDLVHGNHQIDLFNDTAEGIRLSERMDHIKHRFGVDKIVRAVTLDVSGRIRTDVNLFKG